MPNDRRFGFGQNWLAFVSSLDDRRVESAQQGLTEMLGSIAGRSFIDVGSGSGIMSLAAHRLGARVVSFDYDDDSVECTRAVARRYGAEWPIEQGSVLDRAYLSKLGTFDVVYSWGVLHHTGSMWQALENVIGLTTPTGQLCVAIYNDQGWRSTYWTSMKRLYNTNALGRGFVTALHFFPLYLGRVVWRALRGLRTERRGMSLWYDYIDWIGGYPFEVASIAALTRFFEARGFRLEKAIDVGTKSGCNEIAFRRLS